MGNVLARTRIGSDQLSGRFIESMVGRGLTPKEFDRWRSNNLT
jgi:hypothetical protein